MRNNNSRHRKLVFVEYLLLVKDSSIFHDRCLICQKVTGEKSHSFSGLVTMKTIAMIHAINSLEFLLSLPGEDLNE